jgi:hypothetical protein
LLIFSEAAVYSRRAYLFELFRCFRGDAEGRPLGDEGHLLPHEKCYRKEVMPQIENVTQIKRGL